ncbi:MAG: FGGY-family carbohydrate kinase [Gammaproteobacteria bacterium]|nr:FGGY-family carbohydrate kinase [Gammaproteobacteria bacterium]
MSDEPLILAIDFGTQSVRAILFDLSGHEHAHATITINEPQAPKPGWVEQDADYLWDSLCQACRQLWTDPGFKQRIAAVALSTMRSSVVPVDTNGRALRPVILWPDQRRTRGVPPVNGWHGLLHGLAGVRDTVAYFQAEAEANWLPTHEPDIWSRTHRYLMLSGYLIQRLTGEFRDSSGSQVGYVPFDFKRRCWAAKSSWKWRALPWMRSELLPDLVQPGDEIGTIQPRAAEQTGIPVGTRMIAAAADKACEVLGAGATQTNVACLSYGTAATVNVTSQKYIEPIPMVPPYPSAMPEAWNLEIQISRGFWLVSWFKSEFGQPEIERAEQLGVSAEMLIDELLEKSVPGAMGLLAQPYWSPGLRSPGPEARGAIVGFSSIHTRADVYRALLEGIVYALREGKERIERRSRHRVDSLRVAGGGSRGNAVMQLTANIFGLPVARPHNTETSALGAAINAAVGLGLHPDYATATKAMTHTGDVFDPDPATSELYEALYQQTYLPLYEKLKPIYRAMRELTGFRP